MCCRPVARPHPGVPPARIALAWLLGRPEVTAPIVGATRPEHVADAVAAVDLTLTDEETARVIAPSRPHRILGHS
jgi:aryl-alcohol dehydrogenase-like predicted oxidoreductase